MSSVARQTHETLHERLDELRHSLRADIAQLENRIGDTDVKRTLEDATRAARTAARLEETIRRMGDDLAALKAANTRADIKTLRSTLNEIVEQQRARDATFARAAERYDGTARALSEMRRDLLRRVSDSNAKVVDLNDDVAAQVGMVEERMDAIEKTMRQPQETQNEVLRRLDQVVQQHQRADGPSKRDFAALARTVETLTSTRTATRASDDDALRRTVAAAVQTAMAEYATRHVRAADPSPDPKRPAQPPAPPAPSETALPTDASHEARRSQDVQILQTELLAKLVDKLNARSTERDDDDDGTATQPDDEASCTDALKRIETKEERIPQDERHLTTYLFHKMDYDTFLNAFRFRLDACKQGDSTRAFDDIISALGNSHKTFNYINKSGHPSACALYNAVRAHRELIKRCLRWETAKYGYSIQDKVVQAAEEQFRKGSGKRKHHFDYKDVLTKATKNATPASRGKSSKPWRGQQQHQQQPQQQQQSQQQTSQPGQRQAQGSSQGFRPP